MMARAGEWEEVAYRRMGGSRGVREDLSEITRALARQLYVVADFLAPPPPSRPSPTPPPCSPSPSSSVVATGPSAASSSSSSTAIIGDRSNLTEIGGGVKTGFVALSCMLRNSVDSEGGGKKVGGKVSRAPPVVGITEDVLKFVDFLSGRPEEWVQCPVRLDNHFEMTDARKEHITSVERLVPSLATLKAKLCPNQISEGTFWKIYLFLLHPKLSEHDSEHLSTLQVVEEMDRALQDLRNKIIKRLENSRAEACIPATNERVCEIEEVDSDVPLEASANFEKASSWAHAVDRENIDHWLEDVEFFASQDVRKQQLGSEDEVFLSDLEIEDGLLGLKRLTSSSSLEVVHVSPPGSCSEWTPLRPRSGLPPRSNHQIHRGKRRDYRADGESSDWVDAGDSDSTLG